MKRDGNLFHRAKIHDWESIEPHDVMERFDLVHDLKQISGMELAPILKAVGPRVAIMIVNLLQRFKKHD